MPLAAWCALLTAPPCALQGVYIADALSMGLGDFLSSKAELEFEISESNREKLEFEKSELAADIREVYAEAKGNGFDTKIMRQIIKLRKMEEPDRREQDELLDLYRRALEV